MKNKFYLITILIVLSIGSTAQQASKITIETGAIINTSLVKNQNLKSQPGTTSYYNWDYKYYNSTGYFLKVGYEAKLFSKSKWGFFAPIGFSYLSQITKFERNGISYGCFSFESGHELRTIENKIANFSFGFTSQFQSNKWRYTGNIVFNNCLTFDSKVKSLMYGQSNFYSYQHVFFNSYISSQLGVMYQLKSKFWIGPTCEIVYGNSLHLIGQVSRALHKNNFYYNESPSINITGKNIWINPGIKLQIDLK